MVYLAGPMDDVSKEEARGWREDLAAHAPAGVAFFSPAHAYLNVNRISFPYVDLMNRGAIVACHAMIANLMSGGMGFGTTREIEHAISVRTPVWVCGPVAHSMMTHDLKIAPDPELALADILATVDNMRSKLQDHPISQMFPWLGHTEQED